MDIVWVFIGFGLGTVAHEAGHVVTGLAAGYQIHMVLLGEGRILARVRFRETWIELRHILWCGKVYAYAEPVRRRRQEIIFVLGGVMGNAAVIAAIILLYRSLPLSLQRGAGLIGVVQAYQIFNSVIPRAVNDARLVMDAFKFVDGTPSPESASYREALRYLCDGQEPPQVNSPAALRLFRHLSCEPAAYVRHADAYDAVQRELARGGLAPEIELYALDGLVTRTLIFGEPGLRERLDEWSKRALELKPDLLTVRGSRGAALVETGRVDEGKAMLLAVLAEEPDAPFDVLMSQLFLAKAELELGDVEAARQWLDAASSAAAATPTLRSYADALFVRIAERIDACPR